LVDSMGILIATNDSLNGEKEGRLSCTSGSQKKTIIKCYI
jgi:hypothetical protein